MRLAKRESRSPHQRSVSRAIRSRLHIVVTLALGTVAAAACSSNPTTPSPPPSETSGPPPAPPAPAPPAPTGIVSDSALFTLVTQTEPFSNYALFPNLEAGADGVLAASSAHQPLIRVRLNATAASALQNGRDRKSTRLNSSHLGISYAVFC